MLYIKHWVESTIFCFYPPIYTSLFWCSGVLVRSKALIIRSQLHFSKGPHGMADWLATNLEIPWSTSALVIPQNDLQNSTSVPVIEQGSSKQEAPLILPVSCFPGLFIILDSVIDTNFWFFPPSSKDRQFKVVIPPITWLVFLVHIPLVEADCKPPC